MARAKRSASEIAKAMLGGGTTTAKRAKQPAKPAKRANQPPAKPAKAASAKPAAKKPAPAKSRSLGDVLEAARDAVARSDDATALGLLLDAWRAVPAAELANAIDEVGTRAKQGLPAPAGATPKARNEAWTAAARAGDPVTRGILLDSVAATKGSADTLARLELLVPHRDPRVAARIVDLVETPIYNASVSRTKPYWKRLFELLSALGDPRILERQRGFAAAWDANKELNPPEPPELKKRLAAALPAITKAYADAPVLAPADAARCAAVLAAAAGGRSDPDARTDADLLAAIHAAPDDDHPRMVYADWLQQRGDPRGELIALQLAGAREASPANARREKQLLAEYQLRWLGPLAKLVDRAEATFERGFLAVCEAKALDDDPMWATVRDLTGAVPASDRCHVQGLRILRGLGNAHVEQLAQLARPLAVEALYWNGPAFAADDAGDARAIAAFAAIRCLPALRHLELTGTWQDPIPLEALAFLWSAPASTRLETLVIPADQRRLAAAIAAVAKTPIRRVVVRGEHARYSWRIEIERDAADQLSRLTATGPWAHAELYAETVLAGLEAIGASALTSARIVFGHAHTHRDFEARFATALARQTRLESPPAILPPRG